MPRLGRRTTTPKVTWRIERGPYLDAYLLRSKMSKPDIIIRYGKTLDYQFQNFAEAETLGRQIIALPKIITALQAVQDLLNSNRDDVEHVLHLVDDALNVV